MTFKEYMILAHRTSVFSSEGSRKDEKGSEQHQLMCVLGLVGEAGELDEAIVSRDLTLMKYEVGDCFWYVSESIQAFGFQPVLLVENCDLVGKKREYAACRIADHMKKVVFHKKTLDRSLLYSNLVVYVNTLVAECWCQGWSLENEIFPMNIQKLQERYPHGF